MSSKWANELYSWHAYLPSRREIGSPLIWAIRGGESPSGGGRRLEWRGAGELLTAERAAAPVNLCGRAVRMREP
jgi:hypothetical protein